MDAADAEAATRGKAEASWKVAEEKGRDEDAEKGKVEEGGGVKVVGDKLKEKEAGKE